MKKVPSSLLALLAALLLLVPVSAWAHGDDHHSDETRETVAPAQNNLSTEERLSALEEGVADGDSSESDPRSIEKRLQALEEKQTEIYHTLAEKKAAGLASSITDRITLSGLLEVEGGAEGIDFSDSTSDSNSDLVLATAQLGFGVELTDQVSGNITFLFEEDETDLEVDEAAIDVNYAPIFARFGRIYVPFGVFHSHFISDPLTLELGETRETAALIGYGHDFFSFSAFVFNGDAEKTGEEDHIRDWGASLVLTPTDGLELGGSYLSDLADTDAELAAEYRRRVGGWSAFATLEHGPFGASAEILGAAKSFDADDLDEDGNGNGDKPLAWNLEISWAPAEQIELAIRYEESDEFAGQPEQQYGVDASWSPWEYMTFSLEYLRGEFDQDFAGDLENLAGSPADKRDLVTAQLSVEF